MKLLKYWMMVGLVMFGTACIFADSKDNANTVEQESKMKSCNRSSVWTVRLCTRCGGSGMQVATVSNNSKNTVTKLLLACPKCNGRGYEGMTKN